ncbi:hypothetical protein J3R83DRAFT_7659 [Lanmaoa asiatica]|nr:hypothetical protein J3R83DRAFT_7659 [Lanmaoa asiatica]
MIPTPSPSPPAPLSSDPLIVNAPLTFFTRVTLPENVPPILIERLTLSLGVNSFLVRARRHCIVCYFLAQRLPVLAKRLRADGDTTEVIDFHCSQPMLCPYRLLQPSTPFPRFSSEVYSSLHHSNSGGDGSDVCATSAEPYELAEGHEVCIHGQTNTRPYLQSREAYAVWLGSSVHSRPSINHIHVVAVAYAALRRAYLLPR